MVVLYAVGDWRPRFSTFQQQQTSEGYRNNETGVEKCSHEKIEYLKKQLLIEHSWYTKKSETYKTLLSVHSAMKDELKQACSIIEILKTLAKVDDVHHLLNQKTVFIHRLRQKY